MNELNNLKVKNSTSYLHLNISSSYHIDELRAVLHNLNNLSFNIIGITETSLNVNKTPIVDINLSGYAIAHMATKSRKGGALLYIKSDQTYKTRTDLNIYREKELESIFVELINPQKPNVIVGCIYRHPCMAIKEFNDILIKDLLETLSKENKQVLLLGDFNINLLNCDICSNTSDFLNGITSSSLTPCITQQTRITPSTKTLIDNIFVNF